MDTSETYVKMCEKAFGDIGFIDQSYRTYLSQLRNLYCCRNEFNQGKFAFLAQSEAPTDNWWQIYFQDQLQEMVDVKKDIPFGILLIDAFYDWAKQTYRPIAFGDDSMTWEQLWLAFVMKKKFGKVWSQEKEDWVADDRQIAC